MKDFLIKLNHQKYSTLVIPVLAVGLGLVQIIQCYENWNYFREQGSHDAIHSFSNDYYHGMDRLVLEGNNNDALVNTSSISRDFSALKGDSKPSKGKPGLNNIIAYHRSLHNVSWAVTIPLFTFLLPIANSGDPVTLGNQALYGFFAAVIIIIGYAVPILFNGFVPPGARSLENNKITLKHLMHPGHVMNLVGINLQNQLGIDPMQCLQKTVCEAYRSPQNEKYGILVKPLHYLFPVKNADGAKNIYEIAANDGKFTKTNCGKKYQCMFDILDLLSYLVSVYNRSRERTKEIQQS